MLAFLLLLVIQFTPLEQQDPFSGTWEGELTHEGGFSEAYQFQLNLKKEGDFYTGTTVVQVEDIYAEMTLNAEALSDQLILINDLKIKRFEIKDGMEWCVKSYQLLRSFDGDEELLQGTWQGKTSFADCIPGKVLLRRAGDRA